jgi:hypothetical protein
MRGRLGKANHIRPHGILVENDSEAYVTKNTKTLKARQFQRLFRQLGFRLRKPRPEIAQADPLLQAVVKKTP